MARKIPLKLTILAFIAAVVVCLPLMFSIVFQLRYNDMVSELEGFGATIIVDEYQLGYSKSSATLKFSFVPTNALYDPAIHDVVEIRSNILPYPFFDDDQPDSQILVANSHIFFNEEPLSYGEPTARFFVTASSEISLLVDIPRSDIKIKSTGLRINIDDLALFYSDEIGSGESALRYSISKLGLSHRHKNTQLDGIEGSFLSTGQLKASLFDSGVISIDHVDYADRLSRRSLAFNSLSAITETQARQSMLSGSLSLNVDDVVVDKKAALSLETALSFDGLDQSSLMKLVESLENLKTKNYSQKVYGQRFLKTVRSFLPKLLAQNPSIQLGPTKILTAEGIVEADLKASLEDFKAHQLKTEQLLKNLNAEFTSKVTDSIVLGMLESMYYKSISAINKVSVTSNTTMSSQIRDTARDASTRTVASYIDEGFLIQDADVLELSVSLDNAEVTLNSLPAVPVSEFSFDFLAPYLSGIIGDL